jgi:hypothetical protein
MARGTRWILEVRAKLQAPFEYISSDLLSRPGRSPLGRPHDVTGCQHQPKRSLHQITPRPCGHFSDLSSSVVSGPSHVMASQPGVDVVVSLHSADHAHALLVCPVGGCGLRSTRLPPRLLSSRHRYKFTPIGPFRHDTYYTTYNIILLPDITYNSISLPYTLPGPALTQHELDHPANGVSIH